MSGGLKSQKMGKSFAQARQQVRYGMSDQEQVIYVALGSNLGDRWSSLERARESLARVMRLDLASSIYETEPWGFEDQPRFLNQVVKARTPLPPEAVLGHLKEIERSMGRRPSFRYGPRLIDLDLLFYGEERHESESLTLPHPHLHERAFVLVPLAEIAAELKHPVLEKSIEQLLSEVDDSGVRLFPEPVQAHGGLYSPAMTVGSNHFRWGERTFIMGVLNVTPDSFSGDGLLSADDPVQAAVELAKQFEQAGADLLDIGGQSTRPGSEAIEADEEVKRVIPVIKAVAQEVNTPLCVDTFYASVAGAAIESGVSMVNDVWSFRADPDMAPFIAASGVPVVLMHNRMTPKNAEIAERLGGRYVGVEYDNLIEDIRSELMIAVRSAREAGVADEAVILDPGIGFGKTVEQNLELVNQLSEIRDLGFPLLIGPSRKSFIGFTLDLPPEERIEGTAAAIAIGIDRGADLIRVHDVEAMVRVARMTDAIVRTPPTID